MSTNLWRFTGIRGYPFPTEIVGLVKADTVEEAAKKLRAHGLEAMKIESENPDFQRVRRNAQQKELLQRLLNSSNDEIFVIEKTADPSSNIVSLEAYRRQQGLTP
jgi:hypothetical protein